MVERFSIPRSHVRGKPPAVAGAAGGVGAPCGRRSPPADYWPPASMANPSAPTPPRSWSHRGHPPPRPPRPALPASFDSEHDRRRLVDLDRGVIDAEAAVKHGVQRLDQA